MRKRRGFWSWAGRLELFLLKVVVMAFVVFFLVQAIFVGDPLERMVTVFEGVEGLNFAQDRQLTDRETINTGDSAAEAELEAEITLALVDYSSLQRAKVLVNGEVKGNFQNKYISVSIQEGDILELDGSFYSHPFKVKVLKVSPALAGIKEGQKFTVNDEILTLGEVRFLPPQDNEPVSLPTPGI